MFEGAASCSFPNHFEYCNLLLIDISSALLRSLEKQLNWALKTVSYRSRNKCSTSLRLFEEILGKKQKIDVKWFDLLFSILKNGRSTFQNHPKLPTVSFRMNDRNKKKYIERARFVYGSFFYTFGRSWTSSEIGIRFNGIRSNALWLVEKTPSNSIWDFDWFRSYFVRSYSAFQDFLTH